jgi:hypothetical protein
VVPLTFNTVNAWANGNANTYALTTLCSALARIFHRPGEFGGVGAGVVRWV